MDKKSTLVAMLVFMVACLTACGSGSHESMFSEIPDIYEKKLVEASKTIKGVAETNNHDIEAAMDALAKLKTAIDEAEKESKPTADKSQMCLDLVIEAEATASMSQTSRQYYFLMDGETPICYSNCTFDGMAEGKAANVTISVYAPDAPAEQIDRCRSLKFVSKDTFKAQKETIDKQLDDWNEKMAKDLGFVK